MKFREKFRKKKILTFFLFILMLLSFGILATSTVLAQDSAVDLFGGEGSAIQEQTGLSDAGLGEVIGNMINIVLSLIGTVLVILIIYAGIVWMTAGGDEEKVTKAKAILRNAVIGLVIIMTSWVIASFVVNSLNSAVSDEGAYGGSGSGGLGGGGGSGGLGGGDYGDEVFQVSNIIPEGDIAIRNVKVKIYFNHSVDVATVIGENIKIQNEGLDILGELNVVHSRLVEFIPDEFCPDPHSSYHCFAADSDFEVLISHLMLDTDANALAEDYSSLFHTGSLIDVESPVISILEPSNYQSVSVEDTVGIQGQYSDDSGVAVAEFYADGEIFGNPIVFSPAELSGSVYQLWATTGIEALTTIPLQIRVTDLADNSSVSPTVRVYTRPEHCFNNQLDESDGELDIDCGGDCGACSGGACSEDSDCNSGLCVSGTCRYPVKITGISPEAGASGNIISVLGINFGDYDPALSKLSFISQLDGQGFVADFACGLNNWFDDRVVIEVPEFITANNDDLFIIEITTSYDCGSELCTDNTENDSAWRGYFEYNSNLILPGLCDMSSKEGYSKSQVALRGINLDTSGEVYFGEYLADQNGAWGDSEIDGILVPYLQEGRMQVKVLTAAGDYTNPLYFKVLESEDIPFIDSVSPDNGAPGQYVYIAGENFGNTIANVWFSNNIVGQVAGDSSFPAICMDSWWTDDGIVIKVPSIPLDDYSIMVETTDGESNTFLFTVSNRPLSPGICKIDPVSGPPSTIVDIYGDNFTNSPQTIRIDTTEFTNINDWSDQEIEAMLPEIEAGRYSLRVINDSGDYSNDYGFKVQYCNDDNQCDGKVCCEDGSCRENCDEAVLGEAFFQWKFSTGTIPFLPKVIEEKDCSTNLQSPSPWISSSRACVNTSLSARFNTVMMDASVQNAVTVYDCVDDNNCVCTGADPCAEITGNISIIDTSETDDDGNLREMNGFIFNPDVLLSQNNYYKVVIDDSAMSVDGNNLQADYSWQFKVRDDATFCSIEKVRVFPLLKYLVPGEIASYNTLLEGENCTILNPDNYTFLWSAQNNAEPFIGLVTEMGADEFDSEKEVEALIETPEGHPAELRVAVNDGGNTYSNDRLAEVHVIEGSLSLAVKNISSCISSYTSPSPYRNGSDVCTNSLISAQFTTEVDITTLTSSNIHLNACDGDFGEENFDCSDSINLTIGASSYLRNGDNQVIGFMASPSADLAANTWYQGEIIGGDLGIMGWVELDGETIESYLDNTYKWYFHTGSGNCEIEKIIINPAEAHIKRPMGEQSYITYPVAANCNVINALTKSWSWLSSRPSAINFLMMADPRQTVQALEETDGVEIDIMASADGVSAISKLLINFEKPYLLDNFPECNNACINSAVGVGFDQSIDPSRLDMELYRCANESCLEYNSILITENWLSIGDGHEITPADNMVMMMDLSANLDPFNFYKVVVKDVYADISNKAMANYNDDLDDDGDLDAYVWKFKTKSDEELCAIQSVNLSPVNTYSNTIGEKQDYLAMSISGPDECSLKGNYLNPFNFNWEWESSDINRVNLSDESISLDLPEYCNSKCLLTGSQSSLVVCGNAVLERGEDCDFGDTNDGDGCSRNCLWEGGTEASCGNGVIDLGEECDVALSSAGCDENCLHIGILEAVCGNNRIEDGEACDDGNLMFGDGCGLDCLLEGSQIAFDSCGNGIIENDIGEACDDGNLNNNDGCSDSCELEGYHSYLVNGNAICGDGITQSGDAGIVSLARGEACDDGNNFNGDGCSLNCLLEGETFTGENCGDGNIDFGEACDDGNDVDGDACSSRCLLEGSASVKPSCANGILERGEACDDGNIYNNDACSNTCLWEGIDFTGTDCGNGIKDYGEACDFATDEFCNTSCQWIGSGLATDSVCGNGEIGEGEDCDDGNRFSGDGCSDRCLNEGTMANDDVAVCGNEIIERSLGEECDDGNSELGDGCSDSCLREGNTLASCGNSVVDNGEAGTENLFEDCDDGNNINGDGCSSRCLSEGSSYQYSSVCGNGDIETGEECESSILATKISPYQWAVIEQFISDSDNPNTSTAIISATEMGSLITGTAKVILECSFTEDTECPYGSIDYGVGSNKCCYNRPTIVNHLPVAGEIEVCRNPQMQLMFNGTVDEASLKAGIHILRIEDTDDLSTCAISPNYKSTLSDESLCDFTDWSPSVEYIETNLGDRVILQTLVTIKLRDTLDANSKYYMVYTDEVKELHNVSIKHETTALTILDNDGDIVPADIYHFTTAGDICELSSIQIVNIDSGDSAPFSLVLPEKLKTYQAFSYDNRGKVIAPISGIYDWNWQWLIEPTDIVALDIIDDTLGNPSGLVNLGPISNGLANLSAKATVVSSLSSYACTKDNECNSGLCVAGSCQDQISTDQNIDVFVCANPWPSSRMYTNDMFNFGMRYCRDTNVDKVCYGGERSGNVCDTSSDCPTVSGIGSELCAKDINMDIPTLRISTIIPPTIVQETTGLLREYLFNVVREKSICYDADLNIIQDGGEDLECIGDRKIAKCLGTFAEGGYEGTCLALPSNELSLTGDAIGLRVFLNPTHVDINTWYDENMPASSVALKNMKIDGYGALQAGRNHYIHAANLVPNVDSYDLYTNVFLFTHNNEATSITKAIYSELLESLYFNMNLYSTATYQMWQDWQSSAYANKKKIIRDVKRLEDLQKISNTLEAYKINEGTYPELTAGTLLPGVSYSTWASWDGELGLSIVDPINKFTTDACPYSVGVCVDNLGIETDDLCATKLDCTELGCEDCTCVESIDHLYNQKTCYNSSTQEFDEVKVYDSKPDAHVYRYESIDDGARYLFDYRMEYLEHISIIEDGSEVGSSIIGLAGACYSEGNWFEEGEAHPVELFTLCHFGRWVSSCGNGIIEDGREGTEDLGEQCESGIEMCSETFGDEAWYSPQTKVCNDCLWQGICSDDRDRSCSTTEDCQVEEIIACLDHELIPGIKTCQGLGANSGKLCAIDEDCMSFGTCMSFEDSYEVAYGTCSLRDDLGIETITNTSCDVLNTRCQDNYSNFYCQHGTEIEKACVDNAGRFSILGASCRNDLQCNLLLGGSCEEKYTCYNAMTDSYEKSGEICKSDLDCNTTEGFYCEASWIESANGVCYTQANSATDYSCQQDSDCNISTNCKIIAGGGGFSEADCEGYCGDAEIQTEREVCDWNHPDYSNTDNPDSDKPFCSYSCNSSCPSGENGEIFYGGNTYFLRKYCEAGVNDGLACIDNEDCPDGLCQVDTLYDLVFEAQDGFPTGLNLYLPACQRLAQGQWTCSSSNADYLKEGAWCNPDYLEHCVDSEGVIGACTEASGGFEPSSFTTDIEFNNIALPSNHILFIVDNSGSMGLAHGGGDVYCDDPWGNNDPTCSYEVDDGTKILTCPTATKGMCTSACGDLDLLMSSMDRYCMTASNEVLECTTFKTPDECSSSCRSVSTAIGEYCSVEMSHEETRDCLDVSSPHADCLAVGLTSCETAVNAPDERIECAVDALVNPTEGGLKQLVDLDDSDIYFSSLRYSNDVSPSFADFEWYDKDAYGDLITDINLYNAVGGTYTNLAFDRALEVFNAIPEAEQLDQKMVILLTDGDATDEVLTLASALALKEAGVKIFTITYPDAVANSDLWSSECPADPTLSSPLYPPCSDEPRYSYQGVGADQSLPEIYGEIFDSFNLDFSVGEATQVLYSGRYIPLPGEYHCQSEAQLLPVNISISPYLSGEIEVTNLRFNYCP